MRYSWGLAIVLAGVVTGAGVTVQSQAGTQKPREVPTFTKDVAPILFRNCTSCHRPGEIAPMSLLTYEDARPYARAMFEETRDGNMPPWHAEAPEGTFHNERRLTPAEKEIIARWSNGGAPRGTTPMPPAPKYADGWQLGTPDKIYEMTEPYEVPDKGTVEYEYFYIPTDLTEPTWVKGIEIRPGAREVVHHVLMYYMAKPVAPPTQLLARNPDQVRLPQTTSQGKAPRRRIPGMARQLVATYAPGTNAQTMPEGTAIRLEPGGVIELQMHYTTNGTATKDRTRIGLFLSNEKSPREVRIAEFFNGQLKLPAGAADVAVDAEVGFPQDTTLWGLFPHTHLRGKKWRHVLVLPDGTKKTILDVPRYDFNWQTYYMFKTPLEIPAGSKIISTAWYDNSAKNPANPDPKADVYWGDQTWEEMQYTGLIFTPKRQ